MAMSLSVATNLRQPSWSVENVLSARETDRRAKDLVSQAETRLLQREQEVVQERFNLESKRERIAALINSALEVLEEENSQENRETLEDAIQVAQKAQLLPELRVKARKVLDKGRRDSRRVERQEAQLKRLSRQLEALSNAGSKARVTVIDAVGGDGFDEATVAAGGEVVTKLPPVGSPSGCARETRRRRREDGHREGVLLKQLRLALSEASMAGVDEVVVNEAEAIVRHVERRRRMETKAEQRLRDLLLLDNAGDISEQLQLMQEKSKALGQGAKTVVSEVQDKIKKLLQHEQHQEWLNKEMREAAMRSDGQRLRQLVDQARALSLTVPPETLAMLHGIEETLRTTDPDEHRAAREVKEPKEPPSRLQAFAQRQQEKAEVSLAEVDPEVPTVQDLSHAKQAIAVAKQTKVPEDAILDLEKRLAGLERKYEPRFQVEERLHAIIRNTELLAPDGTLDDVELRESSQVEELRTLLQDARRHEADPDLVEVAQDLLDRSMEAEVLRREAEFYLRRALARPMRNEVDIDLLQEAVAEGRRCGAATHHAERELKRLRHDQVQREAAEAELLEASKGNGAKGRKRLEDAIQHAKNVGVSDRKVQVANARLNDLCQHEERCSLVAGNIRRALPTLHKEPWRFQQLMDMVKPLKPWTPELERLIVTGEERLRQSLKLQTKQTEVQKQLQGLLKQMQSTRTGGQSASSEDAANLAELLESARGVGDVDEELLREADRHLHSLRRERCQRDAAEHRLRLALKARDYVEIERSMRQVRALDHAVSDTGMLGGGAASGGGRSEPPHSARLMDAASSMLRHLSDSNARRQAAQAALQERLHPDGPSPALERGVGAGGGASAPSSGRGEKDWFAEVTNALHEARQCGVAPSVIEQAKREVRERRREDRERAQACKSLERVLSKRDAPPQEVLRNLHKVQRLGGATTASQ
mmetsp:Transcript_140282/g.355918  ORF Transcript_140282/g.355918 Transcript_140282/m.355918 type:complete len:936 (-) Transcript_140282:8-2815(-)